MKIMYSSVFWLTFASALAITACSTANVRVMPGPDGTNRVVVRDIDKYEAEQAAVEAAKSQCEEHGQETVFLADDVKYTGDLEESDREAIRRASDSATVLAGIVRAAEATDSAIIFEGAAVGRSVTSGKDYEAEVHFTCEPK